MASESRGASEWTCDACTTVNRASAWCCDVCETARPGRGAVSSDGAGSSGPGVLVGGVAGAGGGAKASPIDREDFAAVANALACLNACTDSAELLRELHKQTLQITEFRADRERRRAAGPAPAEPPSALAALTSHPLGLMGALAQCKPGAVPDTGAVAAPGGPAVQPHAQPNPMAAATPPSVDAAAKQNSKTPEAAAPNPMAAAPAATAGPTGLMGATGAVGVAGAPKAAAAPAVSAAPAPSAAPAVAAGECRAGCGFHGQAALQGYCSVCHKRLFGPAAGAALGSGSGSDVKSRAPDAKGVVADPSTAIVLVADDSAKAGAAGAKDSKDGGGGAAAKRRRALRAQMLAKVVVGAKLAELTHFCAAATGLTPLKLYNKLRAEDVYFTAAQARQLRAKLLSLPHVRAAAGGVLSAGAAAAAGPSAGGGGAANNSAVSTAYEHVLCCRVVDREALSETGVEGQYECDHYPRDYAVADSGVALLF